MNDKAVKEFAKLLSEADEKGRQALLKRANLLAMQEADPEVFEPPISTLGEYLARPIDVPPTLVEPTLLVRGGVLATIGRAGKGKEQPLDAKVLTPEGWTTMGDLSVGRLVSNPVTGRTSTVTGVFPQGRKPIYRVTTSDGATTEVGLEHLWEVLPRGGTSNIQLTTEEILKFGIRTKGKRRFALPPIEPIEFVENNLPIDPYCLGLLIGDGGLSVSTRVIFSTKDSELVTALEHGLQLKLKFCGGSSCDYNVVGAYRELIPSLESLGLQVCSNEKRIPEIYKYSSVNTRLAILQGLMDSDGEGSAGEFCSASKQLVDDVVELTRSLGGRAKVSIRKSGIHWRTRVKLPRGMNPFRLQRKAKKYGVKDHHPTRFIDSIEYIGEKECQCIMVDHYRHLYITDDYIVTHNTVMNLNRLLKWSVGRPMFEGFKDHDGNPLLMPVKPLRILIIENEGSAGMFHKQIGLMLNAEGYLSEDDRVLAKENVFIWGEGGWSGLKLDREQDLNNVKAGIEKFKPDIVFLEPFRGLWQGEENSATDMAYVVDALVGVATEYDCAVMISHHERKSGAGDDGEKMSSGRGSTVLEGAATIMENFESVKGGEYRELSWSKSRYHEAPQPVRMEWDAGAWWYKFVPLDEIEQAVIDALEEADGEALSVVDFMEVLEESDPKVRKILKRMVENGRLKRNKSSGPGGYKYRIKTEGDDNGGGLDM